MSIVKMKKLRLFGVLEERQALLRELQLMGGVEVVETEEISDFNGSRLFKRDAAIADTPYPEYAKKLERAIEISGKYAEKSSGMFAAKPVRTVDELFDDDTLNKAVQAAEETIETHDELLRCRAEQARILAEMESLRPWLELDIPLDKLATRFSSAVLGTIPARIDADAFAESVYAAAEETQVCLISSDKRRHYVLILAHECAKAAIDEPLRENGFSAISFDGKRGTAEENISADADELERAREREETLRSQLEALAADGDEMRLALDRCEQETSREATMAEMASSQRVFLLTGWLPEPETARLEALTQRFCCAWELADPEEDEYPQTPVKLKNNALTAPLNAVTEMYSLPAYDGLDPNPLMAPFFIAFYGIMMADMAYGILMMLMSLFMIKKLKAKGGMRNFAGLLALCGVSTFIVGAMTGGFFGDFIPQIVKMTSGRDIALPALFTPLDDTIAILIGSVALGFLQIITGMAISVVRKIKSGDFLDALFDEITWWIILAGAAMAILGVGSIKGVPVTLVTGAAMLVFGGTRKAKGFGKVGSLIGLLYNGVSGFFSDALSYTRLMALMLAGSVIAQVFNTLGSVVGNVVGFVLISFVGNILNFVLNLLGCYVHDLRLQCLEYFGRFYKEGGKPFKPLEIKTKYTDIIKEEN